MARYVIFDENIPGNRVVTMMLAMIVARGEGCGGDQERLRNGVIDVNITTKAARSDVDTK